MSIWTTDKPTRPGYYWLRNYLFAENKEHGFSVTHEPMIVHLYTSFGEPLGLTFTGNDCVSSPDDLAEAEWYGPIVAPTEGIDNFNRDETPRIMNSKQVTEHEDDEPPSEFSLNLIITCKRTICQEFIDHPDDSSATAELARECATEILRAAGVEDLGGCPLCQG